MFGFAVNRCVVTSDVKKFGYPPSIVVDLIMRAGSSSDVCALLGMHLHGELGSISLWIILCGFRASGLGVILDMTN